MRDLRLAIAFKIGNDLADLGHIPGADSAALSVYYPTYFRVTGPIPTEHYTRADDFAGSEVTALPEFVSPGFFDLFRLPRLQGRDFSWDDGPGKPAVALVSASLARALFPAGDAIGRHVTFRVYRDGRTVDLEVTPVELVTG